MGYVKLDEDILRSSLWVDRDMKDVFLAALLLARPKVFTLPSPQLEVEAIIETGFVVPPGEYGFVASSGEGLILSAQLDLREGFEALKELGEEDPTSRSQEYGGRRLVRVNGGYLVLNFMRYRDKDHTVTERVKRFRQRKKEAAAEATARQRRSGPDATLGVGEGTATQFNPEDALVYWRRVREKGLEAFKDCPAEIRKMLEDGNA